MIPIKIHCACGQRYAFEVEPVNGQVASPVACPACGADGSAAANAAIAQSAPTPVPAAAPLPQASQPKAAPTLRVQPTVAAAHAPRRTTHQPGQLDRPQAEIEARAKILWGDAPREVTSFLMGTGIPYAEAAAIVDALCQERAATLRGTGIKKIVLGIVMMAIPLVAFAIFFSIGYIFVKTAITTVLIGLWGILTFIRGWVILVSPESQSGDVTEQ